MEPSTCVRNSTRSAPSHSTVSWVTCRPPRSSSATRRRPAGQDSGRTGGAAGTGTGRAQQPRALSPARVPGMLGLQQQLVAAAAGLQQLGPGALVQQPAEGAAAGRVGLDGEGVVLQPEAVS